MKVAPIVVAAAFFATLAPAQSRVVRATGQAVISVKPDLARVNIGVVTQAATAQGAASQNAAQLEAVLAQLRQALGSTGETKTIVYSITPDYRYTQGQPAVLTGYTVTNTLEVTTSDLNGVGRIIDAATQAGANSAGSLRFGIQNEEPVRSQALSAAAKQARAHAEAIAGGLGGKVGAVITAQEGVATGPVPTDSRTTLTGTTPIEAGLVEVRAIVTVDCELQ